MNKNLKEKYLILKTKVEDLRETLKTETILSISNFGVRLTNSIEEVAELVEMNGGTSYSEECSNLTKLVSLIDAISEVDVVYKSYTKALEQCNYLIECLEQDLT